MPFERSVFVNCPFDEAYVPLLRPLLFTILRIGFTPRIALESLDSGRPRIDKIVQLIRESRYSIHDLSRIKASREGEFFRLNMPFELGLDVGARLFGNAVLLEKRCLILETERYRYQAAISDLSNSDIVAHGDTPVRIVRAVRDWLGQQAELGPLPGPARYWNDFTEFEAKLYDKLMARGYSSDDIGNLSIPEFIESARTWIEVHRI